MARPRIALPYVGARLFDGSTGYFSNTAHTSAVPVTMAAWVRTNTSAGQQAIIAWTTSGPQIRLNGQKLELLKTLTAVIATSVKPISIYAWNHVAATFDGTNWQLFINGDLDSAGANANVVNGITTINIGRDPGANASFFSGSIVDAAAWFQILTAGDIRRLAKEGIPSRYIRGTASTTFFNLPLQAGGNGNEYGVQDGQDVWTVNGTVTMADGPGMKWFRPELIALNQGAGGAAPSAQVLGLQQLLMI